MAEFNKLLEENNLPQVDALQYNAIKTASEKQKRDTSMRTANVRITLINYINYDNEELGVKAGDTVTYTKEEIIEVLDDWAKTKNFSYYLIEHDADPENKHIHIVIVFDKNSVCKFSLLKKKFPYGDIETCKFGVKNCVQYLVHMNNPEKYQYSWDNVVTNNTAKLELYKIPTKHSDDAKLNYILTQIYNGGIKEYEIGSKIDYDIFLKYENKIMRAFRYLHKQNVVAVDRELQVFVLQGPPRVGKSTFCKCWAKKHNMSIAFSSSGKNAFDEYLGQDVYVLDDFDYSLSRIDKMKKFLDPHNNASAEARYENACFINCKVIFICTNTSIVEWYIGASKEDRDAFYKRISYVLDFEDISDDFVSSYTINEIVYSGENDSFEYAQNMYMEYKKYILQPVDDMIHTFDLKQYINPNNDEEKKKQFLAEIDSI